MSVKAINWAKGQRTRNIGCKCILLILADGADENGRVHRSLTIKRIAKLADASVRAVKHNLGELQEAGLITRNRRHDANGWRIGDGIELALKGTASLGAESALRPRYKKQHAKVPFSVSLGAESAPQDSVSSPSIVRSTNVLLENKPPAPSSKPSREEADPKPKVLEPRILPDGTRIIRVLVPFPQPKPPEPKPRPAKTRPADIDEAFAAWNALAADYGLPIAQRLTAARRANLKARLRDAGGLEGWRHALKLVSGLSPYFAGRNNSGWKANLDWLLKESNFVNLMEGSYGKDQASGPAGKAGHRGGTSADVIHLVDIVTDELKRRRGL